MPNLALEKRGWSSISRSEWVCNPADKGNAVDTAVQSRFEADLQRFHGRAHGQLFHHVDEDPTRSLFAGHDRLDQLSLSLIKIDQIELHAGFIEARGIVPDRSWPWIW